MTGYEIKTYLTFYQDSKQDKTPHGEMKTSGSIFVDPKILTKAKKEPGIPDDSFIRKISDEAEARNREIKEKFSDAPVPVLNGIIEPTKQGYSGDCWLLSGINSLSNTTKGRAMLKELVKVDKDGNVKVELRGVKKNYTITKEEIAQIKTKNHFSTGDDDVLAIEMAFEKYRRDLIVNNEGSYFRQSLKNVGTPSSEDVLRGGFTKNAIEVLTGKYTAQYNTTRDNRYIGKDYKVQKGTLDEKFIGEFLNKPDKYVMTVSFKGAVATVQEHHGYSVSGADKNFVYLLDPADSSKTLKISKKDFYSDITAFTISDFE